MFPHDLQFIRPTREFRELAVLLEIGEDPRASQRSLARAAGVSATMINAYVDGLVGRGLLQVTGETNRTYRYFLTSEGRKRSEGLRRRLLAEVARLEACVREAPPDLRLRA